MTPDRAEERLYGLPHAEQMYSDPETVFESEIEPYVDHSHRGPWEVEEWSVADSDSHIPTTDSILEWIVDWVGDSGEVDEHGFDAFAKAALAQDVRDVADGLRGVLASKVQYRMAAKHLRSLTVTIGEDDEPLLDGKPMYHKVAQ